MASILRANCMFYAPISDNDRSCEMRHFLNNIMNLMMEVKPTGHCINDLYKTVIS